VLDNQIGCEMTPQLRREIPLEEAVELVKDALTSVGERDIETGDAMDIFVITKDGTRHQRLDLKKD
jgi:20S proteasome subunit beta 6